MTRSFEGPLRRVMEDTNGEKPFCMRHFFAPIIYSSMTVTEAIYGQLNALKN